MYLGLRICKFVLEHKTKQNKKNLKEIIMQYSVKHVKPSNM